MSRSTVKIRTRLPWEDRWNMPAEQALMKPLGDQHKRILPQLIERLEEFPGVSRELVWHGAAWKWCWQFSLADDKGKDLGPVIFLVPDPEGPVFCMPLEHDTIEQLPFRRLNRFVRDAIRLGKCAVDLRWCVWNPSAMTEVEHLLDLFKRVHKIRLGLDPRKPVKLNGKTKKAAG